MSFEILTTHNFRREARKLAKKYKSLPADLLSFSQELAKNPRMGTHLGQGVYKIRMAIKSKGGGKSGGARIISQVKVTNERVYLFSIYSKSQKSDIQDKEIKILLKKLAEEYPD